MSFAVTYPEYLLLLFLIPLLLLLHFLTLRYKNQQAIRFSNFEALSKIKNVDFYSKNLTGLILSILILACISFSLSGLVWYGEVSAVDSSFVIAIDNSGSMAANDFYPSRLEVAKTNAIDFVDKVLDGTRIGVLSFSGNSFIESKMSEDSAAVENVINNIKLSSIGGTDIYDAVFSSTTLLQGESVKSVILISDGQINVGNIDDAITYASDNGVVFYTFGIGSEQGGQTLFGISKIDEDSLKALAKGTGGSYFRVSEEKDFVSSLENILTFKLRNKQTKLSNYLSLAAIILFLLYFYLSNTRHRIIP